MSYHHPELTKARALLESSPLSRTSLSRDHHDHVIDAILEGEDDESYSLRDIPWFPQSLVRYVDDRTTKALVLAEREYTSSGHQNKETDSEEFIKFLIDFGSILQDAAGIVEASLLNVKPMQMDEKEQIESDVVQLLQHTCTIYKEAHDLSGGTSGKILFNWAVVLSDIGRLVKDQRERIEYAVASCLKYSGVVTIQEDNIQALNNWGLVICDLAHYCAVGRSDPDSGDKVKKQLLKLAMSCFRRAICRYNGVNDRAVLARCTYNMGSVMYQYGLMIENDLQMNSAHASQYVSLAYALDHSSEFFSKALQSVHQFLPLPFLRYTKSVYIYDESREDIGMQQWLSRGLVVNTYSVRTVQINSVEVIDMEINMQDITSCHICVDPWIPFGYGLYIRLKGSTNGIYISADSKEEVQGLRDAIIMLQISSNTGLQKLNHILSSKKLDI